jgi:hypothetical protein
MEIVLAAKMRLCFAGFVEPRTSQDHSVSVRPAKHDFPLGVDGAVIEVRADFFQEMFRAIPERKFIQRRANTKRICRKVRENEDEICTHLLECFNQCTVAQWQNSHDSQASGLGIAFQNGDELHQAVSPGTGNVVEQDHDDAYPALGRSLQAAGRGEHALFPCTFPPRSAIWIKNQVFVRFCAAFAWTDYCQASHVDTLSNPITAKVNVKELP